MADIDKNLTRILDQQAQVKMIIERDIRVKSLRKSISQSKKLIEEIRKRCAKIAMDAMRERQELLDSHAKEHEGFQVAQLKSIANDYLRHQEILETRKREIESLKKEVVDIDKNRAKYLADVERSLERQLAQRQQLGPVGTLPSTIHDDNGKEPVSIELTTVDEYAPYGSTSDFRMPTTSGPKRGGTGRGRGRRRATQT